MRSIPVVVGSLRSWHLQRLGGGKRPKKMHRTLPDGGEPAEDNLQCQPPVSLPRAVFPSWTVTGRREQVAKYEGRGLCCASLRFVLPYVVVSVVFLDLNDLLTIMNLSRP